MSELALIFLQLAAKEGIPRALDLFDKMLGQLPGTDPTAADWAKLRDKINTPFDELVSENNP